MIDRQLVAYLKVVHAVFNTLLMLAFFSQAWMGLKIRSARKAGRPLPLPDIKRHRKTGPVLVLLGVTGLVSGMTLILLDTGDPLKYLFHLGNGTALISSMGATLFVSRKIAGTAVRARDLHFGIGGFILCVYIVQFVSGLSILL